MQVLDKDTNSRFTTYKRITILSHFQFRPPFLAYPDFLHYKADRVTGPFVNDLLSMLLSMTSLKEPVNHNRKGNSVAEERVIARFHFVNERIAPSFAE